MSLSRREFLEVLAVAAASGLPLAAPARAGAQPETRSTTCRASATSSLLHFTDCHAQLLPVHFREPSVEHRRRARGRAGRRTWSAKRCSSISASRPARREAHAFTHLDFERAAQAYGKVGGFAHLATLVKRLRAERPDALLLDGGDSWQGSATALWTNGQDMIDASKLLGVDVMTGALGVHLRRRARQGSRREGLQPARSSSSRRT